MSGAHGAPTPAARDPAPCSPLRAAAPLFWILLHRFWVKWADAVAIVKPKTVVVRRALEARFRSRYLLFSAEVIRAAISMALTPTRTSYQSPWQNGTAERWVGCCRQELLDNVVVLNQTHLGRLLREYVEYHHDDRTHCGLGKQTPAGRSSEPRPSLGAKVVALPRIGGLHHRYTWRVAA